jgi:hypothetical protein
VVQRARCAPRRPLSNGGMAAFICRAACSRPSLPPLRAPPALTQLGECMRQGHCDAWETPPKGYSTEFVPA